STVWTASDGTVKPAAAVSVTTDAVTAEPAGGRPPPLGRARMTVAPLSAFAAAATPVTTASNSPFGPCTRTGSPVRTWAASAGGALNTNSTRAGLVTSATTPPWATKPPGPTWTLVTTPEMGLTTLIRPEALGEPAAVARARAARAMASALAAWAWEASTS